MVFGVWESAVLEEMDVLEAVEEKRMEGDRIQRDIYVFLLLWELGNEPLLADWDEEEGKKLRGRRINRDVT